MDNTQTVSSDLLAPSSREQPPEPAKVRYYALMLYVLSLVSASAQAMTVAPLAVSLAKIYDQDPTIVGLVSTSQMVVYPVFTFVATSLMRKYGLQRAIQIGTLIVTLGSGVRGITIFTHDFKWVLVGQILIGMGRPIVLNFQGDIAQTFFGQRQRTQIAGILNFLMIVSMTAGVIVSTTVFYGYDDVDLIEGRDKFDLVQKFEITYSVAVLLLIITFPNRRGQPAPKINFVKLSLALIKNTRYLPIFIGFACTIGSLQASGVVQPFMSDCFGFHTSDNGYFSFVPMFGGVVLMPFLGPAYKATGKFKPWVSGLLVFCMGCQFLEYYSFTTERLIVVLGFKTLSGIFMMPVTAYLVEWGAKAGHPVDNSFSSGMMYSGSNLMGALFAQIQIWILGGDKATLQRALWAVGFVAFLYFITLVCAVLADEPLRKATILQVQDSAPDNPRHFKDDEYNIKSAITDTCSEDNTK